MKIMFSGVVSGQCHLDVQIGDSRDRPGNRSELVSSCTVSETKFQRTDPSQKFQLQTFN